jgi:hypothetical protein
MHDFINDVVLPIWMIIMMIITSILGGTLVYGLLIGAIKYTTQ